MGVSNFPGISLIPVVRSVNFIVDGGGVAITTGRKGYVVVDFDARVYGWVVAADQPGSVVCDIKKCSYGNFPTTVSIAGSEKPTLSGTDKNEDLDLTTWDQKLVPGDILEFVIDSVSTVTRVTFDLRLQ